MRKSEEEIAVMTDNGKALARIMKRLGEEMEPGGKAKDLNDLARDLIFNFEAEPSFKGYKQFPASLCVSLNEEIVHGAPGEKVFKRGDLVSLDVGLFKNGFHADMARTFALGEAGGEKKKLMEVTKKALKIGIEKVRPGNTLGDVGAAIQKYVEKRGFNVVRELCGHGVGRELHQQPQVLNYGEEGRGEEIKKGMVLCLEPMVTAGDWRLEKKGGGYAYVTTDNSLSAHFEDMVVVGERESEVLTRL